MMPDTKRFNPLNIKQYYSIKEHVVILSYGNVDNNNVIYTYNANTPALANYIVSQIDVAVNSTSTSVITISLIPMASGLVWTSVSPDTATAGATYSGTITGSGFETLNGTLTFIQAKDSAGHIFNDDGNSIVSDTEIDFGFDGTPLTPAGVYELYYVTGGGVYKNATGLSITSS